MEIFRLQPLETVLFVVHKRRERERERVRVSVCVCVREQEQEYRNELP